MTSQGISSTKNSMLLKRKDLDLMYKTHLCINFKRYGRCNYGDNCIFIHASQDAKGLPPQGEWKENFSDAKRLKSQNMVAGKADAAARLCRWFSSRGECPYGVKCVYLHERLERPYGDVGTITRSDAIRIGTSSDSGPRSPCLRQIEWKTKLCQKWSMTNFCSYSSRCTFAHGQAELRDNSLSQMMRDPILKMVTTTYLPLLTSRKEAAAESIMHQQLAKKWCFDREQGKKIVGIYADWVDDLLVRF